MKNKKFWIILLFCLFLLFGWAIWNAFLTDVIPRHRTYFGSYDSFRSKASRSRLAMQLPESAWDIKYYWSVDRFVHVAGYGMSLSEEDYEKWKVQTLERYGRDGTITTEVRYLYSENSEKICVQEEWIKRYGVGNIDALLLEGESLKDYYVLAYDYVDNDSYTYFTCMICNDSLRRAIEMDCTNMNVVPGR